MNEWVHQVVYTHPWNRFQMSVIISNRSLIQTILLLSLSVPDSPSPFPLSFTSAELLLLLLHLL